MPKGVRGITREDIALAAEIQRLEREGRLRARETFNPRPPGSELEVTSWPPRWHPIPVDDWATWQGLGHVTGEVPPG